MPVISPEEQPKQKYNVCQECGEVSRLGLHYDYLTRRWICDDCEYDKNKE